MLDTGCILKVEAIGSSEKLDGRIGAERRREESRQLARFGLEQLEEWRCHSLKAGGCGVQELRFGCTEFRGLLHDQVEMLR